MIDSWMFNVANTDQQPHPAMRVEADGDFLKSFVQYGMKPKEIGTFGDSSKILPLRTFVDDYSVKSIDKVSTPLDIIAELPRTDNLLLSALGTAPHLAGTALTDDEVNNLSLNEIADIFKKNKILGVIGGLFHKYDSKTGCWEPLGDDAADIYIRRTIDGNLKSRISSYVTKEMIKWLRADKQLEIDIEEVEKNSQRFIVFENGAIDIFDPEGFKLLPHNPSHYATCYIHAKFNPKAVQAFYFPRYLRDITAGDKTGKMHDQLQEVSGLAISNIRNLKKIIIFIGGKDSGKTVCINMLIYIIGLDVCSSMSLDAITKDKYAVASLYGKKINACGESSQIQRSGLDIAKKLSGGDLISGRHPFGREFQFYNKALLLFANNQPLKIIGGEAGDAFKERLLPINFPTRIPEDQQDPDLLEKLLCEREYIVQWALEGLKRLIENGYKFTQVDLPVDDYIEDSTTEFMNFLSENVTFDIEGFCSTERLLVSYHDHCRKRAIHPIKDDRVHDILKDDSRITQTRTKKGQEKQSRGYSGMRLISED